MLRATIIFVAFVFLVFLIVDDPVGDFAAFGENIASNWSEPSGDLEARKIDEAGLRVSLCPRCSRQNRREVVVLRDWLYCDDDTGDVFLVPAGFVTDFASIPAPARVAISSCGRHAEAAVIHDWLYAIGTPGDETARNVADRLFLQAMKEQRVNFIKRRAMHSTVAFGGGGAFGQESDYAFVDAETFQPVDPPFPQPATAPITRLDSCKRLSAARKRILAEHGTAEIAAE